MKPQPPDDGLLRGVRAAVLAGGKSRRLGRDKASLLLQGRPLVDWAVQSAADAGLPTSVIREDSTPGLGPLGGVQTAFECFEEDRLIFLSCDAPFLGNAPVLRLLRAGKQSRPAAFYVAAGCPGFPFLLSRQAAPAVAENLAQGRRSVRELAARLRGVLIPVAKEEQQRFHNINTWADWAEAERIAALSL